MAGRDMASAYHDPAGWMTYYIVLMFLASVTQASAQSSLTITELKRLQSGVVASNFTLHLGFRANTKPEVSWYTLIWIRKNVFTWFTLEYDETTKVGTAKLEIDKTQRNVYCSLGDLRGHHFTFRWNMDDGDQNLELSMNLPESTVLPGTDLPYTPGKNTTVTIQVKKQPRGNGVNFDATRFLLTGMCYKDGKIVEFLPGQPPAFLQTQIKDLRATTSTEFTFLTSQTTINGFFYGWLPGRPTDRRSSPFYYMEEMFYLRVHENTNGGPFPDTLVFAEFRYADIDCKKYTKYPWGGCQLHCYAYGNAIDTLEILKVNVDGSVTVPAGVVPSPVSRMNAFTANTDLLLNTADPAMKGTYVCRGTHGAVQSEARVSALNNAARTRIQSLQFKRLSNGKLEVICKASGLRPLTFKVELSNKDGTIKETLLPLSPPDESDTTYVSASFTSNLIDASDASFATCRAETWAESSYDMKSDMVTVPAG